MNAILRWRFLRRRLTRASTTGPSSCPGSATSETGFSEQSECEALRRRMGEIERYRERALVATRQVGNLPRAGWGEPGPPDEQTGERWDRSHVLGHMAEMLPFWTGQLRAAVGGETAFGRGETGYAERRRAIETGRDVGEDELLARIDSGLAGLLG